MLCVPTIIMYNLTNMKWYEGNGLCAFMFSEGQGDHQAERTLSYYHIYCGPHPSDLSETQVQE